MSPSLFQSLIDHSSCFHQPNPSTILYIPALHTSVLKMETEGFSKTLVTTYMTTQCGKPEGHNLNSALFTVSLSIALAFCDCFSLACPPQTELKYSSLLVVHIIVS
jgi:hypothetical protein